MTEINSKVTIPGYRIIRKIGEGGMSVVYLAYQESLKREVALKVMRPIITDEENVVRRFEQEAEIIAKLYHPNIVNIYEVGHMDNDILYYSMPYLQHGDLTTFTYSNDEQLKEVMVGICEGMAFAHTQGVVHRDIKPENILFDQFGHVQIADFGIALSTGRRRFTRENRIVGSIHYMSPEQAQSKHVDARSDIYGLGAILFEVLTGEPVFNEEDDLSLMIAHVNKDIPKLPEELSHWQPIIDKCLAKSPNHRYQNMTSLKNDILAINSEVEAPKSSWFKVMSLMMVLGLSTALWYYQDYYRPYLVEYGFLEDNEPIQTIETTVQTTPQQQEDPMGVDPITEVDPPFNNKDEIIDLTVDEPVLTEDEVVEEDPIIPEETKPEVVNNLSNSQVTDLIKKAKYNIIKKQLTTPKDDNALDQILLLLKNIPDHKEGLGLLSQVMAGYYDLIYKSVSKNDIEQAAKFAESVAEVRHKTILTYESLMVSLEENTELERSLLLGAIAEKVKLAKGRFNRNKTQQLIALIDVVMPGHEIIDELNSIVSQMPKGGKVLRDSRGLRSVVVEPENDEVKGLVKYALAVNQTEVSYRLFDEFVRATGHKISRCKSAVGSNLIFSQRNYTKPGFKVANNMPVVCITWQDANLFIKWYNNDTGEHYRLPTITEWRHIIKLSGVSYPQCLAENLAGTEFPNKDPEFKVQNCDDGYPFVSPLWSMKKNKLGLYGLHGNVAEWLGGCQKLGKIKAIFNTEDPCESNPSAGFSWYSGQSDRGNIKQIKFDQAWSHIGFRMVKKLN